MNYYNEFDRDAAAWLKELIAAGCIPPGVVDTRSILEVMPGDLAGFKQCHFFAGIGGWSLALALAGWRADEPVWTGSCPCQPYSVAGAGDGDDDPRALWWAFRWLITHCSPSTVFGEQVASKDGRRWFDGVRADLEALGYAVGGADLCAAGVTAPHIRQRLYWMADSGSIRRRPQRLPDAGYDRAIAGADRQYLLCGLADTQHDGRSLAHGASTQPCGYGQDGRLHHGSAGGHGNVGLACGNHSEQYADNGAVRPQGGHHVGGCCDGSGLGHPYGERQQEQRQPVAVHEREWWQEFERTGSGLYDAWGGAEWIPCGDGKARRIKPLIVPLVDGFPGRVGLVRGYGNAIVPPLAAEFIGACMEVLGC